MSISKSVGLILVRIGQTVEETGLSMVRPCRFKWERVALNAGIYGGFVLLGMTTTMMFIGVLLR